MRTYIKEWRRFRGMRQDDLAAEAGIAKASLSRIETGAMGFAVSTLEALATALRCSPGELIMRNPETTPDDIFLLFERIPESRRVAAMEVLKALAGPERSEQGPADVAAERQLLGAILFDNSAYELIRDPLAFGEFGLADFYEPLHRSLFKAMADRIEQGLLADPVVIMEQLRGTPHFEQAGGLSYLADLVDAAPPARSAPDYARHLHDLAEQRRAAAS